MNPPPHYTQFYSLILCHYNEIGLKAPRYRAMLEKLVIRHFKILALREGLTLQSIIQIPNRLIFALPNDQILKACSIFRYLLGIQSFSPAFTVPKDLNQIKTTLVNFGGTYFRSKDKFSVKFKSIKALPQKFREIEKEIGAFLESELKKRKIFVRFINGVTEKTLFIELREEEGFIYTEKVPTLWGGMPLEASKACFCPFTGTPEELVAAHLMLRRGMIVIPLLMDFKDRILPRSENEERIGIHCAELAKFYPDPMPVVKIDIDWVFKIVEESLISKSNLHPDSPLFTSCDFCLAIQIKIIDLLIEESRTHPLTSLGEDAVSPKSCLFLTSLENNSALRAQEMFQFVSLYPLSGLSEETIHQFYHEIMSPVKKISKYTTLAKKSMKSIFQVHKILHPTQIPKKAKEELLEGRERRNSCIMEPFCKKFNTQQANNPNKNAINEPNPSHVTIPSYLTPENIALIDHTFTLNRERILKTVKMETISGKILAEE